MLDYETVRNNSFTKDVITNEIVNENLLYRFEESWAYLKVLSEYYKKCKCTKIVGLLAVFNAGVIVLGLPFLDFLDKAVADEWLASMILLGFFAISTVLTILIIGGFFFASGSTVSKTQIKRLAVEQELVFKEFFLEFVNLQILPSVNQDFLATKLRSELSLFLVKTKNDDKDINKRDIVLAGLYRTGDETVEVAIVLRFNFDYSKLELQNYHVSQRIASSRFGGSDNGS